MAKPFEKTNNSLKFRQTELIKQPITQYNENTKPKAYKFIEEENQNNKKQVVSLTTGFSIRRNANNSNNPYTLTVITRPFDNFNQSRKSESPYQANFIKENNKETIEKYEDSISKKNIIEFPSRKSDSSQEYYESDEEEPTNFEQINVNYENEQSKELPVVGPKYYLKTVIKRPAPFILTNEHQEASTENNIETDVLIDKALQNTQSQELVDKSSRNNDHFEKSDHPEPEIEKTWTEPLVSPYRTLNNLQKDVNYNALKQNHNYNIDRTTLTTRYLPRRPNVVIDYTTTTPKPSAFKNIHSTDKNSNNFESHILPIKGKDGIVEYTTHQTTTVQNVILPTTEKTTTMNSNKNDYTVSPPSYWNYKYEVQTEPTTEIFSGKAKQILKAFFNNFVTTTPQYTAQKINTESTFSPSLVSTEKTVNIGFHKKYNKYENPEPIQKSIKRIQIISEPTINTFKQELQDEYPEEVKHLMSTSEMSTYNPYSVMKTDSTTTTSRTSENQKNFDENENSHKFRKIISQVTKEKEEAENKIKYNKIDTEPIELTRTYYVSPNVTHLTRQKSDIDTNDALTNITHSTTSKTIPSTSTKSNSPFPTRASRVNPAIKLAAKNLGGGRRSYQSSSKCSSDDSLQANPKCNEIKYQRYTSLHTGH